jgi:hypothetical protein
MQTIYDGDGNELGQIPLTPKQQAVLDAGAVLTVQYHTPQLMHAALGQRSGTFTVHKDGERLISATPKSVKDFVAMQAAIAAVRARNA